MDRLLLPRLALLCAVIAGSSLASAESLENSTVPEARMVSRLEWGAQPPAGPPNLLEILPPNRVIICHTARSSCYTQAQCTLTVRVIQTFHIESKGWKDIGYNFLVGGNGNIYEGRGWDTEGAHTFNYNSRSIGIALIGSFEINKPTEAQILATKYLLELAVEQKKLSEDYKLFGQRQLIKTSSPGQNLYTIIQKWNHWSDNPQ